MYSVHHMECSPKAEYTKICLFTEVREFLTNSNPGFRGGVCVMWYKAAQ